MDRALQSTTRSPRAVIRNLTKDLTDDDEMAKDLKGMDLTDDDDGSAKNMNNQNLYELVSDDITVGSAFKGRPGGAIDMPYHPPENTPVPAGGLMNDSENQLKPDLDTEDNNEIMKKSEVLSMFQEMLAQQNQVLAQQNQKFILQSEQFDQKFNKMFLHFRTFSANRTNFCRLTKIPNDCFQTSGNSS